MKRILLFLAMAATAAAQSVSGTKTIPNTSGTYTWTGPQTFTSGTLGEMMVTGTIQATGAGRIVATSSTDGAAATVIATSASNAAITAQAMATSGSSVAQTTITSATAGVYTRITSGTEVAGSLYSQSSGSLSGTAVAVLRNPVSIYQTESECWVKRGRVIWPTQEWEGSACFEPSVLPPSGTFGWRMWYTGNGGIDTQSIGYATSPTGLAGTWTKYAGNPVMGYAKDGDEVCAGRGSILVDSGTLYSFSTNGTLGGTLKVRTSPVSDGINWTPPVTALTGVSGAQNSHVVKISGTYYMFCEYDSGGNWKTLMATSTTPGGPYTVAEQPYSPIDGIYTYSSTGWTRQYGDRWEYWSHAWNGSTGWIQRATSYNFGQSPLTATFVDSGTNSLTVTGTDTIPFDGDDWSVDQYGDAEVHDAGSGAFMFVDANHNSGGGYFAEVWLFASDIPSINTTTPDANSATNSEASYPLTTGLVAAYAFGDGHELEDNSGNKHTLTETGDVTFSGGVASFDGSSWLTCESLIANRREYTIACKAQLSATGGNQQIFGDDSHGWMFTNSGFIAQSYDGDDWAYSNGPSEDTEEHSFIVRAKNGKFSLWVDGVKMSEDTIISPGSGTFSSGGFALGINPNGSSYPLTGTISKVCVWNRGLSDSEISAVYNNGNHWMP